MICSGGVLMMVMDRQVNSNQQEYGRYAAESELDNVC